MTAALIWSLVIVGALADVALFALRGGDATISTVITRASRRSPIIAFAAGVLAGHWFWQTGA